MPNTRTHHRSDQHRSEHRRHRSHRHRYGHGEHHHHEYDHEHSHHHKKFLQFTAEQRDIVLLFAGGVFALVFFLLVLWF